MHQHIDIAALVRGALLRGHTTASLGREIGLSQPTVSRLARGVAKPTPSMLAALRLVELAGGVIRIPDAGAAAESEARHAA